MPTKKKILKKALSKVRKSKDGKKISNSIVGKQAQLINIKIDLSKKKTGTQQPQLTPTKKPSQTFYIPYQQPQQDLTSLLNYITKTSQPLRQLETKETGTILNKQIEEPTIPERIELMKKNQEELIQKYKTGSEKPTENMVSIEEQLERRLNRAKDELEYYKREEEYRRTKEAEQRRINAEKQRERRKQKKEGLKQPEVESEIPFWEHTLEEDDRGGGGGESKREEKGLDLNKLNNMNLDDLQSLASNNSIEWVTPIKNKKGEEVYKYKTKKELRQELKQLFNL